MLVMRWLDLGCFVIKLTQFFKSSSKVHYNAVFCFFQYAAGSKDFWYYIGNLFTVYLIFPSTFYLHHHPIYNMTLTWVPTNATNTSILTEQRICIIVVQSPVLLLSLLAYFFVENTHPAYNLYQLH